jgi:hypothetical protein
MKPDIHGVRTHWIRGFMAFQLARRARVVVLMVLVWPESGFRKVSRGCGHELCGRKQLQRRERGMGVALVE